MNMNNKAGLFLKHYASGAVISSFNGATSALSAVLGLAAGSAVSDKCPSPTAAAAAAVFAVAFARNIVRYAELHPIPEDLLVDVDADPIISDQPKNP